MTDEKPITDEDLDAIERAANDMAPGQVAVVLPVDYARRLVAEVRRLRELAECRGCQAGHRRGPDFMHYDDANGGATWGVCMRWANKSSREEEHRLRDVVRRLRSDEWVRRAARELEQCSGSPYSEDEAVAILRKHRDGA